MKTTIEDFKAKIERWEAIQLRLADFGAQATEPDGKFQKCLRNHYNKVAFSIPETPQDWELYSNTRGVNAAARKLTKALKDCLKSMDEVTIEEMPELNTFLNEYLWRY